MVNGKKSTVDLNPFAKEMIADDVTALPKNGEQKDVTGAPLENLDLYKRSGTYIEYGNDIEPDLTRAKLL